MVRFFIAALLMATLLTVQPGGAQTVSDPVQTDSSIGVGEDTVSDTQIRDRINTLVRQITGFQNVTVSVSGGVVRLQGQVLDNTRRAELEGIVNRVEGVVAIENETTISTSLEERLEPAVDRIVDRGRNIALNAPIFIVAFLVFIAIAVLGWLLTTRLAIWQWLAPNKFIADVYRAVARIVFIVVGIVVGLDILNATALLGAVLGAAGVVGLALGFAVRDTVENFIASILLSLRQPFRPNDFVGIDGKEGNVARLTSRATILISPDGNHIRIPNATVFKGQIINYTRDPNRRFTFDLGVDADSDLAAALAAATGALEKLPFVLNDPPVSAWIAEVGDSNVVLTFAAWVDQSRVDFMKARGEAIRVAKTALESAGFGLPEPIYRLRLDERSAQQLSGTLSETETETPSPEPVTPQTETALPAASDPEQASAETSDAVERERRATDAGGDLLNPDKMSE